jgi:hypothetical protein
LRFHRCFVDEQERGPCLLGRPPCPTSSSTPRPRSETSLALAADFWLNGATPSVWLLGYDARQPSSIAALPFGVDDETM